MKIFIVENSTFLQERLGRLISDLSGFRVVGYAATATDAVEKIRETEPAVVILDIRLDEGTGFDVLEEVKLRRRGPIVIVLTNYPYPQYRDKYLGAGADYFFDKSTELDALLGVLSTLREKKSPPRNRPAENA